MTTPSPEQTAEGWDRVADGYAAHIDPGIGAWSDDALEIVPVGAGDRVLDVACGPGALALRAARSGADVVAVDFSKEQIRLLAERADAEGLDGVEARIMDGQDLALDDDSFDAAFSMFGLMIFPDRPKGFTEMHRVLRPGGRAVVGTWAEPGPEGWMALLQETVQTALPDAPDPDPPSFMEIADPKRFEEEMSAGGFADVRVETIEHDQVWPDADTAWTALTRSNPVIPGMLENLGDAATEAIESAFRSICADRFGDGPVRLVDTAHLGVGEEA